MTQPGQALSGTNFLPLNKGNHSISRTSVMIINSLVADPAFEWGALPGQVRVKV